MTTTDDPGDEIQKDYTDDDLRKNFEAEFSAEHAKLGRINLLVIGNTGVGKSTLINKFFDFDVARTGIGKPVTTTMDTYDHPNGLVRFYDSKGFETGDGKRQILDDIAKMVESRRKKDLEEHIHAVWYLIRWSDRRFDDDQADVVKRLKSMGLPVIIVLTQVPTKPHNVDPNEQLHPHARKLAAHIKDRVGDLVVGGTPVFTNAEIDEYNDTHPIYGLQGLVDVTRSILPDAIKGAFDAAQAIDLKRKYNQSLAIVTSAVTAAGAIAFTPIPMSDAPLLVGTQVAMMGAIATRYGLTSSTGQLAKLASAALLAGGTARVAGLALSGLIRFIPGLGTVTAGIINGTIATTLTASIGYAWIKVCEKLAKMSADERERLIGNIAMFTEFFTSEVKSQLKRGKTLPTME